MTKKEMIWEARRQVLYSYIHKFVLVLVAFGGFGMMNWLGDRKEAHDNQKWKETPVIQGVMHDAVERLPPPEESTAGRPALPDDGQDQAAAGKVEPIPAAACGGPSTKEFTTREELIAAMQARAEACVWAEFRGTIQQMRTKIAVIANEKSASEKTLKDLKDYKDYANFVTQEAAFAATRAKAARHYVGTMLANAELPPLPASTKTTNILILRDLDERIRPTLDDKSSLNVVFQILWYASLLLGIGASSMLFVLILTVLPITNGEGYWTKRIGEILDRFPLGSRAFTVPLLAAAAIGGSTLAGAAAETEVGGQARISSSTVEAPTWINTINSWSLVEYGDVYNPTTLTSPVDLTAIAGQIEALDKNTTDLGKKVAATKREVVTAKRRIAAAMRLANSRINDVAITVHDADALLDQVQRTVTGTHVVANDIFACVNQVQTTMGSHTKATDAATQAVEGRENDQKETFSQTLAQGAAIDSRGFFGRTFGWTLYQVGPAVQTMMAARLDNLNPTADKTEKKALLKAIKDMRGGEPLKRKAFREDLVARLMNPTENSNSKGDDLALTPEQINRLMEAHFRALLRICALPR